MSSRVEEQNKEESPRNENSSPMQNGGGDGGWGVGLGGGLGTPVTW